MASTYHDDWQYSRRTVLERNTYMFDNPLISDITFTCGESRRIFHAHKYVLATSSAVFFAMFYGDLAQKESTVRIKDAEDESFQEFLRFLYTDDCKITETNAIGVLYLAKKYLISSLAEKCCKFLETRIKPDNVFEVLEPAIQFDEKELEAKCWEVVSINALEAINTEAFCNISSPILTDLLKKDKMNITEIELFKGVLRWVDNECARQSINIEEDKTARRRVLGDSVYEIRFLTMSQQDFVKYVSPTGVITDADIDSIMQTFNRLDEPSLKWKNQNTRRQSKVSFSRFDIYNVMDSRWTWAYLNGHPDALSLAVNKAVLFHGVRLLGNSNGSEYEVKLTVKNENVTGTYTSAQDNDGVWGYDVMLAKPIPILPDEEFTIMATIKGPRSYRGVDGKSTVKVNDIVLTFKNAPVSTNGTDESNGQFYKIFLGC